LTDPPRTAHDLVVRRVICLVLIVITTLWLPVQPSDSAGEVSHQKAADGAQIERPCPSTDFRAQIAAGNHPLRPVHDSVRPELSSQGLPNYVLSQSVPSSRFRLRLSPRIRTLPLLI
jgi:hypothetical protein